MTDPASQLSNLVLHRAEAIEGPDSVTLLNHNDCYLNRPQIHRERAYRTAEGAVGIWTDFQRRRIAEAEQKLALLRRDLEYVESGKLQRDWTDKEDRT